MWKCFVNLYILTDCIYMFRFSSLSSHFIICYFENSFIKHLSMLLILFYYKWKFFFSNGFPYMVIQNNVYYNHYLLTLSCQRTYITQQHNTSHDVNTMYTKIVFMILYYLNEAFFLCSRHSKPSTQSVFLNNWVIQSKGIPLSKNVHVYLVLELSRWIIPKMSSNL